MWVVDIEANRAEQVLHPGVVGIDSIDKVLIPTTNNHLWARQKKIILLLSPNSPFVLIYLALGLKSIWKCVQFWVALHILQKELYSYVFNFIEQ